MYKIVYWREDSGLGRREVHHWFNSWAEADAWGREHLAGWDPKFIKKD